MTLMGRVIQEPVSTQEQQRKVIRFALGWVRHWQEDVAGNLKPTPESLAMVEAKLKEALEATP